MDLRFEESVYLNSFNEATLEEEAFLKQKSKIQWLREGDGHTGFFHKVVNEKKNRSRIHTVKNLNHVFEGDDVPAAFINHYERFLGTSDQTENIQNPNSLFTKKVVACYFFSMVREITNAEIKSAMFSIGEEKFRHISRVVGRL